MQAPMHLYAHMRLMQSRIQQSTSASPTSQTPLQVPAPLLHLEAYDILLLQNCTRQLMAADLQNLKVNTFLPTWQPVSTTLSNSSPCLQRVSTRYSLA